MSSDAARFVREIFRGAPADVCITISAPERTQSGTSWRSQHLAVTNVDGAVEAAQLADRNALDVYVGLAARRAGLSEWKRGARPDLVGAGCIWLDLDTGAAGHAATNLPPDEAAAALVLEELPKSPSIIVDSAGGYHVYWLLENWCSDVGRVEALCEAWQAIARDAAAQHNWSVDKRDDAASVLRVPGTHNYKIPGQSRDVVLDAGSSFARYPIEALEQLATAAGHAPRRRQPAVQIDVAVPPPTAETIDLAEMRAKLTRVRRAKASSAKPETKLQAERLGRVLDGISLADSDGKRHHARRSVACMIAEYLYTDAGPAPWEAVYELMRATLAATPRLDTDKQDPVEKTKADYLDGVKSTAARRAHYAKDAASRKRLREKIRGTGTAGATEGGEVPCGDETSDPGAVDRDGYCKWEGALLLGKDGRPLACEWNVRVILTCADGFRDAIRFNDVKKKIEVTHGPLIGVDEDMLPVAAAEELQQQHGCMAKSSLVRIVLLRVARDHKFDPIAERLGALEWDGAPRIDSFLERYLGVKADDANTAVYVRAVSRRWLISLVARALSPGCKVDTVLVLEGAQGAKKSTALATLVGQEHFLDTALQLGDKDTMQAISSSWLVELGELASLKKTEIEKVKQFISSQVDKYRPPYGATIIEAPRRCVFVGTTNGSTYLHDQTGNRRYWPVRVGVIDVPAIESDRDLILAEAVAAFRAGERWWLVDAEASAATAEAEARVEEDVWAPAILSWIVDPREKSYDGKAKSVAPTTANALLHAIGKPAKDCGRADEMRVGYILRGAGWRTVRRGSSPRAWVCEQAPRALKLVE